MSQKTRELVFLSRAFLFFLSLSNSCTCRLSDLFRRYAEILEHVIQNAVIIIRENVKNVTAVDNASSLRTSAVHCLLKKFSRFGSDLVTLARMLPAHFHALLDQQLHRSRIDCQVAHCRAEKVVLFSSDGVHD